MRIGFASDIHKLVEGRKLILAGVIVPFEKGELAHSDGDVVYHAITESIFGALAIGDLGTFFPPSDDKFKDMDSSKLMEFAYSKMKEQNMEIENIDVSITLESPKLKPYITNMRENIANLLKTDISNVSVKAGTNEGIDEIGKGLAVKAESIVLLK